MKFVEKEYHGTIKLSKGRDVSVTLECDNEIIRVVTRGFQFQLCDIGAKVSISGRCIGSVIEAWKHIERSPRTDPVLPLPVQFIGRIICISNPCSVDGVLSVFLRVQLLNDNEASSCSANYEEELVIIRKNAAHLHPFLRCGSWYAFRGFSRENIVSIISSSRWTALCNSDTRSVSACIDYSPVCPADVLPQNDCFQVERIAAVYPKYLRPPSVSLRDGYMHSAVDITGVVWRCCMSGHQLLWVEFVGKLDSNCRGDNLFLYPSHGGFPNAVLGCLRRGARVKCREVYPVYLWGRLHGFAMTVRSQCHLLEFAPSKERAITRMSCSDISMLENKCSVFVAWYAYACRKIGQCMPRHGMPTPEPSYLQAIIDLTVPKPEVFSTPTYNLVEEFVDSDYGPLYAIRAGQDSDWLSSLLPEVWTCGMLRQYAENVATYRWKGKSSQTDVLYRVLVEATQRSEIRHETYTCDHPILVVGTLVGGCCNDNGLYSMVLCDSTGCKTVAIISSSSHLDDKCDNQVLNMIAHCTAHKTPHLLVALLNPYVLLEKNPSHNEQSAVVFAILSASEVFTLSQLNLPPRIELEHTRTGNIYQFSDYIRSHIHPYASRTAVGATTKRLPPLGVRQVLMTDTSLPLDMSMLLPPVKGVVIRKEYSKEAASHYCGHTINYKGNYKKRKLSSEKVLIVLRDESYTDSLHVYMLSDVAASCFVGFVVQLHNFNLKLSASNKRLYLDGAADTFAVVENILGIGALVDISQSEELKNSTDMSLLSESTIPLPPPYITIADIYRYRNRCMWTLCGHISAVKKISVYMRCCRCFASANSEAISIARQLRCEFSCSRNCSPGSENFELWWYASFAVNDGTSEAEMILEGPPLLRFFEAALTLLPSECYSFADSSATKINSERNVFSQFRRFPDFRKCIESGVRRTGKSVKYKHFEGQLYVSDFDGDDLFEVSAGDDGEVYLFPTQGVSSCDNGRNETASINYDWVLRLLVRRLRCCVPMTFAVTCIFSRHHSPQNEHGIEGGDKVVKNKLVRNLKVQHSGGPQWAIDNVVYPSECCEMPRLQCLDFKENKVHDTARYGWNVLRCL